MPEKQYTILLVEDEEMLASMYETKFTKEGYKVVKALDGEMGVKLAGECNPDLILLDIIMPKMDGFSALKKIKEIESVKNVPVILLTNLGQDEDIKKGQQLGSAGYLIKANLTPAEVVVKIKEFLK